MLSFRKMLTMIRKYSKIYHSIIIENTIFMMNEFRRDKIPAKIFLHNKIGSFNITSRITIRMFGFINKNVSSQTFIFSPLPIASLRTPQSYFTSIKTFSRTILFSLITRLCYIKIFITNFASNIFSCFFNRFSFLFHNVSIP